LEVELTETCSPLACLERKKQRVREDGERGERKTEREVRGRDRGDGEGERKREREKEERGIGRKGLRERGQRGREKEG
jgi:hypothetical protein